MKKKVLIISFIVLFLDLLSKYLIFHFFDAGIKYSLIGSFLSIYPIKNTGAAFSMFDNMNLFLISISVIILIYLLVVMNKQKEKLFYYLSYGLLIGGLFGNLVDRIVYSSVRDFISFKFFSYEFAIFNVADIAIVVGAIILIFLSLFKEKSVWK